METTEIISTRITLTSEDLNDINNALMRKINNTYAKKCSDNMYIKEILRIVERGDVKVYKYLNTSLLTIDVKIEVLAILYTKKCILPLCKVIKENDMLLCATEDGSAKITFHESKFNELIDNGTIVPAIVTKAEYPKFSDSALVSVKHYRKPKNITFYEITENTNVNYTVTVEFKVNMIKTLLLQLEKCDEFVVKFFTDVLFHTNKLKYGNSILVTDIKLDYQLYKGKMFCVYPTLIGKNFKILQYDINDIKKIDDDMQSGLINRKYFSQINTKQMAFNVFVNNILEKNINVLRALLCLCQEFNTPAKIKKNNSVWDAINKTSKHTSD